MQPFKYLPQVPRDADWGLSVSTAGHQRIAPGLPYPPKGHEKSYLFDPAKGRILDEFQLLYIVSGNGLLSTASAGNMNVASGDMFLLFPGEWHTYYPSLDAGWDEYWIGFRGAAANDKVSFALQFESPEYLSVAFKRIVGMTPTEYRHSVGL